MTQEQDIGDGCYRFGDCEVDAHGREVRIGGREIDIQPRVFDLLVYLISHRERAVDKDELQDAVWPGRVITETALTRAVMKARKAIGDDANRQWAIKTLHGHGYRFIAEIQEPEHAPSPAMAPESVATSGPSARAKRSPALWVLPVVLLVVLAVSWFWIQGNQPRAGDYRIAVLPVVDETGDRDLDWARLGIMSFISGMIDAGGEIRTVADGATMNLAENLGWTGDPEDASGRKVRQQLVSMYAASHVLALVLEGDPPTLRLNYSLYTPDDRVFRGTMVGEQVADLAQGVVQSVYGDLLGRFREHPETPAIADDPFLNEAFARGMALSLEGRCADAQAHYQVIIEAEPELFSPRYERALCLRILGENEAAEALLDDLVGERRALGLNRELGMSLMARGVLMNRTGRLDEAEASHLEALEVATQLQDHDLRGMILNNLAIVAEDRHQLDLAEEYMNRGLMAYAEAGRESPPGHAWSSLANIAMARRELDEADEYQRKALEAFRKVGDRRQEAMMISNTGFLRRLQGRLDEAEMLHLEALRIREEIGDRVGVGRMYNMLSVISNSRGDYPVARDYATQALEVMREVGDRQWEASALSNLADAERYMEEFESAAQHYAEVRDIFIEVQDPMRTLQAELKIARLEEIQGHYDTAERIASNVLERARDGEYAAPEIQAMELMADLALARDDHSLAVTRYAYALERVRDMQWQSKLATLLYKLADTLLGLDDLDAAEPLVGELIQLEPSVNSLKTQAQFAFQRGNVGEAVRLMTDARERAGAHWSEDSQERLADYQAALQASTETRSAE